MTSFSEFYASLESLAKSFEEKNVHLKIDHDPESDIIKIFGQKITALSKAINGLEDVTELSYTTAEHHPYWNLLYQCSQISKTVLEKWNNELSADDVNEIRWSIRELDNAMSKIKQS